MTLKECYDIIGNYDDVLKRLVKESIIEKYLLRFLNDSRYDELCYAIDNNRYEDAYFITHAMKGACLSLGFFKLTESLSKLSEALRKGLNQHDISYVFEKVTTDYNMTVSVISMFINSDNNKNSYRNI